MTDIWVKYATETDLGWHIKEFSLGNIEKGIASKWLSDINAKNEVYKFMYSGIIDKCNNKLYEGDIVLCSDGDYKEIIFSQGQFNVISGDSAKLYTLLYSDYFIANSCEISLHDFIEKQKWQ